MLADQNLWVRLSAAKELGVLGDRTAVPALIEALADDRSAVREEALVAHQTLTGETLKFEPHASDSERTKRVRDWRDWWAKNRDRLQQS
jgi:HEAT repeat protein